MSEKYQVAERAILAAINRGTYTEGDQIPSERSLAASLGISHMTLRRSIGRLVDRGILERRPSVGTFVRRRPSARKQLRNLALLFFNMTAIEPSSFAQGELEGVRLAAAEDDRQLRAMVMMEPRQTPEQLAEELRAMRVGAVGVVNFGLKDRGYIAALNARVPCVLVNKSLPGLALPCAKPDLGQAACDIVEFFVARGRRRIGAMVWDADHSQQQEILAGMTHEMARRNLPIDKSCWFEGADALAREKGSVWLRQQLESAHRPDGLFIFNCAEWLYEIRSLLAERGVRLGRDMDLVVQGSQSEDAGDDVPWAGLSLKYEDVTRNAARLLIEAADAGSGDHPARVLVSNTMLTPPRA